MFVAILVGWVGAPALADTTTAQIYQQRDADGHIVLTDRPAAKSVTERTWQMSREDPAAAERRALEVKREAAAVSERVQKTIDAQLRRSSEEDLMRMRLAMLEQQSDTSNDDTGYGYGGYGYGGYGLPLANRRPLLTHRRLHGMGESSERFPAQLPSPSLSRPTTRPLVPF
jgi:hypothetical protein